MSLDGMGAWGRAHAVGFYALDDLGVEAVARYAMEGWERDELVVGVCLPPLQARVEKAIAELGGDVEAERAKGRYATTDPEASIAAIIVDGRFDPPSFERLARAFVSGEASGGRRVRAFSETIALLWQRGLVDAALELELHWGKAMREHHFQLVCAYPTGPADHASLLDVARITELHSELHSDLGTARPTNPELAEPQGSGLAEGHEHDGAGELGRTHACSRVYRPMPESVPAARHFVIDVLRSWGHDDLTTDAALIVSELATNAFAHAATPFRAVVYRRDGGVRIGIEDATQAAVTPRTPAHDAENGRGASIVDALSQEWGSQRVSTGKVVWADLDLPGRRDPAPTTSA